MRIKKRTQSSNSINLPLEVREFETVNARGQEFVGVKGIDLRTGDGATVFLTTTGRNAENQNRPSLETLAKGFKIGREKYQLEPGGVVSFKGAFPNGHEPGQWIATWPNVIAYNKEERRASLHSETGMLQMFEGAEGRVSGVFYDFLKASIVQSEVGDVRRVVSQLATEAHNQRGAFLVRGLDGEGRVAAYEMATKNYNKEEQRVMTPPEMGAYVEKLVAWMPAHGIEQVSIVPADKYAVSPKALTIDQNGKSKLGAFKAAAQAYIVEHDNGDLEMFAKDSFIKRGGEKLEFINAVIPTDPYGPGVDPALAGGLEYSPNFVTSEDTPAARNVETASTAPPAESPATRGAPEERPAPPPAPEEPVAEGFDDLDDEEFDFGSAPR